MNEPIQHNTLSNKTIIALTVIYILGLTFIFTDNVNVSGGDMAIVLMSFFWSVINVMVQLFLSWLNKKSFLNPIFIIVIIGGIWIKLFISYPMEIRNWYLNFFQ